MNAEPSTGPHLNGSLLPLVLQMMHDRISAIEAHQLQLERDLRALMATRATPTDTASGIVGALRKVIMGEVTKHVAKRVWVIWRSISWPASIAIWGSVLGKWLGFL